MRALWILCLAVTLSQAAEWRTFEVTAYCHCAKCCGKAGQPTASGKMPKTGITVAAPRSIPFGTRVKIEGVGIRIVQDRLAKRYDHRIDLFMSNHKQALAWGKRKLRVQILG